MPFQRHMGLPYSDFVLNIQPDDYQQLNEKIQFFLDNPVRLRYMQVGLTGRHERASVLAKQSLLNTRVPLIKHIICSPMAMLTLSSSYTVAGNLSHAGKKNHDQKELRAEGGVQEQAMPSTYGLA